MSDGYDFTESEGFDFSDDEEVLAAQRDDAKAAEEWDNLDEKTMAGELNGLNSRVSACALQVSRMLTENDYTKTNDMLAALRIKDLSQEGWLFTFVSANADAFKGAAGNARPEFYNGLRPEEKKNYDAALRYYRDAGYLREAAASLYMTLLRLRLAEGFRLMRVKENFDSAGFDTNLYNKVNADVRSISDFLNRSWDELEKNAHWSKKYLEEQLSKLPKRELEKGYRAERLADFQSLVRSCGLLESFVERPDGHYGVRPELQAKARVIDWYTNRVSRTDELKDPMQRTVEECKTILAGELAEAEKNCTTQAGQFLCAAFQGLIEAVSGFAQACLETYVSFKEAKSEAPYCFMKKLSAVSSAKPKYSFSPDTSDPWENGTFYEDIYAGAADALGAQAGLFVYDHGAEIV